MTIATRPESPRADDRLVFLHGFTQTHHHWHRCASLIAARLRSPALAFVDLPGHGLSATDRTAIDQAAPLLTHLGGAGTWIGYSMGARFALVAAAQSPPEIERLVVIGVNPGIEDATERLARRAADDALAVRIERIGVDAFLDEWLRGPLFASLPEDAVDRAHRRANGIDGLASSLRSAGIGSQTPLWENLGEIEIPVLVLAGEADAKFTSIGARLAGELPNATFASIRGAGHAAHTEQPAATADAIAGWIDRQTGQPTARPIANRTP